MSKQNLLTIIFIGVTITLRAGKEVLGKNSFAQKIISFFFNFSESSKRVCHLANQVVSPCYKYYTENTCDNLKNPPQNQTGCDCEYNICVCRKGLYRDERNQCVTKEECYAPREPLQPLVCTGENEELNGCFDPTEAKVCPYIRCSKPRDLFLQAAKRKRRGLCVLTICDCKDGYLRNKCGKCVTADKCSSECSILKSDPCSGPNEIRITKYYKRSSDNNCSNGKAKRRIKKSVCVCKEGFVRDQCNQCLKPDWLGLKAPSCLVTNPCEGVPLNDAEWQCVSKGNQPDCRTMYELQKGKSSPSTDDCYYGCHCRPGLWFNGTNCVLAADCPPYDQTLDLSNVTRTHLGDYYISFLLHIHTIN